MTLLGIRYCSVQPADDARALAKMLGAEGWGFAETDLGIAGDAFAGAVFPAGEASWIELWAAAPGLPEGMMLQIVVDDADRYAAQARARGIEVAGPTDAHGERIYTCRGPGGVSIAVLSALPGDPPGD